MSILTELPPSGIEIDGKKFYIHTSFRNWIEISRLMEKEDGFSARVFALCYKDLPEDPEKAVDGIIKFLHPGFSANKDKNESERHVKSYDFEEDAEYIYADFLRFYNIDLQKTDLHWHVFYALFKALPEDSRIREIMYIRTVDLSKIKNKAEKKRIRELKDVYALSDNRTETEKENDFASALW